MFQKKSEAVVQPLVAGQFILPGGADELGDLRVGVQAGEAVLALRGRADDRHVVEPPGDLQVLLLAGQGIEVGQDLVHAAVLVAEHPSASARR